MNQTSPKRLIVRHEQDILERRVLRKNKSFFGQQNFFQPSLKYSFSFCVLSVALDSLFQVSPSNYHAYFE